MFWFILQKWELILVLINHVKTMAFALVEGGTGSICAIALMVLRDLLVSTVSKLER